jgi:activator of HSP90 ATPase
VVQFPPVRATANLFMRKFNVCHRSAHAEDLGGQRESERKCPDALSKSLTRRQALAGVAIALAGVAADCEVWGDTQEQAVKDTPVAATNHARTFLHQETSFDATPRRIYEALSDAKQFAAFTGMPAEIDPKEGGSFSTFNGMVVGRNVEMIPDHRIVQAWRPTHWDPGIYSIVKFELKPRGSETIIVLDHTGFPEGEFDHLNPGWKWRYWDPLKKFLL